MGEIKGIIHIKDGQVNSLQNVSDRNAALRHEGNLAIVLSELFHIGWKLQGDYTLTLTKTEETDEEREAALVTESKSDTRPVTQVAARRKR